MHEVLGVASGCRLPIVMPVVNRALVSPWSLWCDHQDTMAERDSGWMQFYAENTQEVLDLMLMGYKIAEHCKVMLPLMVCMDGFFVSHSLQQVWLPSQESVDAFLPPYTPKNLFLDMNNPMLINNLIPPEEFTEMRYQQEIAFNNAIDIISSVQNEFNDIFHRDYDMVSTYRCDGAQAVIVSMGSSCGTVKHVVNKLRNNGIRVGAIKVTCFRPFPYKKLKAILKEIKCIGVLDRSAGLGAEFGPLCMEIKNLIGDDKCKVKNFITGLGGRDITEKIIEHIFYGLLDDQFSDKNWIDVQQDAMKIRKLNKKGGSV